MSGPAVALSSSTRLRGERIKLENASLPVKLDLGGRGRGSATVLKEIGPHPESKENLQVKTGRYGPYVTDGETNASLRKGDTVEELTEKILEMIPRRK